MDDADDTEDRPIVSPIHSSENGMLRLEGEDCVLELFLCSSAPTLEDVGTLLWPGSLLLADWLMLAGHVGLLRNVSLLEIGAGVGLLPSLLVSHSPSNGTSFAKSFGLKRFWASDRPEPKDIQRLLVQNVMGNGGLGKVIRILSLDLLDDRHPLWATSPNKKKEFLDSWTETDDTEFQDSCTMILGADIIYEDTLTQALISRLPWLLTEKRSLYLAVERRVRFTVPDLVIRAPAMDFLMDSLQALNVEWKDSGFVFQIDWIDISNLPKVFSNCTRPKEMELLRLQKSHSSNGT